MRLFISYIIVIFLSACSAKRQLAGIQRTVNTTQELVKEESSKIDTLQSMLQERVNEINVDSVLGGAFTSILNKLNDNLSSTQQLALLIQASVTDKKDLKKNRHSELLQKLIVLDSFNAARQKRENVYLLLNESISLVNYKMFHLAAFFDLGVYRIPPKGLNQVKDNFSPIVDSLARMANKYANISREARIVFVGYSDETVINEQTPLYKTLKSILNKESPEQNELNQVLSDLRAKELNRYMKMIMVESASKFINYNSLRIGYVAYGRGQEYPSPSIHDYKKDDERRRIVLCYWVVLPKIEDLH